eukprot:ANDGO_04276.mRNA.1 eIF-2-alpha kinase activator GCN1
MSANVDDVAGIPQMDFAIGMFALTNPSVKFQQTFLHTQFQPWLDATDATVFQESQASEFVAFLSHILISRPPYPETQHAIEDVIYKLCKAASVSELTPAQKSLIEKLNQFFMVTFKRATATLIMNPSMPQGTVLQLVRYITAFIGSVFNLGVPFFNTVASWQACAMNMNLIGNHGSKNRAFMKRMLSVVAKEGRLEELMDKYAAYFLSSESSASVGLLALLDALLSYFFHVPSPLKISYTKHADTLFHVAVRILADCRLRVADSQARPIVLFLMKEGVIPQEKVAGLFQNSVIPALQRSLLRSPENVAGATAFILEKLSFVDMSAHAKKMFENCCTMLKSTNPLVVKDGARLATALYARTKDQKAAAEGATEIARLLRSKPSEASQAAILDFISKHYDPSTMNVCVDAALEVEGNPQAFGRLLKLHCNAASLKSSFKNEALVVEALRFLVHHPSHAADITKELEMLLTQKKNSVPEKVFLAHILNIPSKDFFLDVEVFKKISSASDRLILAEYLFRSDGFGLLKLLLAGDANRRVRSYALQRFSLELLKDFDAAHVTRENLTGIMLNAPKASISSLTPVESVGMLLDAASQHLVDCVVVDGHFNVGHAVECVHRVRFGFSVGILCRISESAAPIEEYFSRRIPQLAKSLRELNDLPMEDISIYEASFLPRIAEDVATPTQTSASVSKGKKPALSALDKKNLEKEKVQKEKEAEAVKLVTETIEQAKKNILEVSSVFVSAARFGREFSPAVTTLLFPGLSSKYIHNECFEALRNLVRCVCYGHGMAPFSQLDENAAESVEDAESLMRMQELILLARRLFGSSLDPTRSAVDDEVPFAFRLLSQFLERLAGRPLSEYAFLFFYPVCDRIISDEQFGLEEEVLSMALALLSMHSPLKSLYRRTDVLATLIKVFDSQFASLYRTAAQSITIAASHATLAELDPVVNGLLAEREIVRAACLNALDACPVLKQVDLFSPESHLLSRNLMIASCVSDRGARLIASHTDGKDVCLSEESYIDTLAPVLTEIPTAALALCRCLRAYPASCPRLLERLCGFYSREFEEKQRTAADRRFGFQKRDPDVGELPTDAKSLLDRVEKEWIPRDIGQAWGASLLIAIAFVECASFIPRSENQLFLSFLLDVAFRGSSGVEYDLYLETGLAFVNAKGTKEAEELLPILLSGLKDSHTAQAPAATVPSAKKNKVSSTAGTAENAHVDDQVTCARVILLGTLCLYLPASHSAMPRIVDAMQAVLKVPSESVQLSVAQCLAPIVHRDKARGKTIATALLQRGFSETVSYPERRGALFGFAGCVKGCGILLLGQLKTMQLLSDAWASNSVTKKDSCLMFIEVVSILVGNLIEPYLKDPILPILKESFNETSDQIKEASVYATRSLMKVLSPFAVQSTLPILWKGLDDRQWRSKAGSVELLGHMAHCAPKQLSAKLPETVPRLLEALHDSHIKVVEAAKRAIERIGGVIRTPEILANVSVFIKALEDPTNKNNIKSALHAITSTRFHHAIDAPSLAIMIPVLERSLGGAQLGSKEFLTSEDRKQASLVVGSLSELVSNERDLLPYSARLLEPLKNVLFDPIPEVRVSAAKAIGKLASHLPKNAFEDGKLDLWFVKIMRSDAGAMERAGAALGLAEFLGALGYEEAFETRFASKFLVLQCTKSADCVVDTSDLSYYGAPEGNEKAYVRDAFLQCVAHIPSVVGDDLGSHVSELLTGAVLPGLADDAENVRRSALKAGQVFVETYSATALSLLLPALEAGLFAGDHRIRHSSVVLLGDLLRFVANQYKDAVELEDEMESEAGMEFVASDQDEGYVDKNMQPISEAAIRKSLGDTRANELLGRLFILRFDVEGFVRSAAVSLFRLIIANPARALRSLLPFLVEMSILGCLASPSAQLRGTGNNALEELATKAPDSMVHEYIPLMKRVFASKDSTDAQKEAVCLGLVEMLESPNSKRIIAVASADVMTQMRAALADPSDVVRTAASAVLDSVMQASGARAMDSIVAPLIQELTAPTPSSEGARERAMSAMDELLDLRAHVVIPVVMQTVDAVAFPGLLGHVARKAATSMGQYVDSLLEQWLVALDRGVALKENVFEGLIGLMHAVSNVNNLIEKLKKWMDRENALVRKACVLCFAAFAEVQGSRIIETCGFEGWIRLLSMVNERADDTDSGVLEQVVLANTALVGSVKKDDALASTAFLSDIWRTWRHARKVAYSGGSANQEYVLPLFASSTKAISPFATLFAAGLGTGTNEQRYLCSRLLAFILVFSPFEILKTQLMTMVGPLIRVLGDYQRTGSTVSSSSTAVVKGGLLLAMHAALVAGAPALKALFPQIQTTVSRALSDSSTTERDALDLDDLVITTRDDRKVVLTAYSTGLLSARTGHALSQSFRVSTIASLACASLAPHIMRPEQFVSDLVRDRHWLALQVAIRSLSGSGKLSKDFVAAQVKSIAVAGISGTRDLPEQLSASQCIHSLLCLIPSDEAAQLFSCELSALDTPSKQVMLCVSASISFAVVPSTVVDLVSSILSSPQSAASAPNDWMAIAKLIRKYVVASHIDKMAVSDAVWIKWMTSLRNVMQSSSNIDIRHAIARVFVRVVRDVALSMEDLRGMSYDAVKLAVSGVVHASRDRILPIKTCGEEAIRVFFAPRSVRVTDWVLNVPDEETIERVLSKGKGVDSEDIDSDFD